MLLIPTLLLAATLTGAVTSADGTPVAGATVVVRQETGVVSSVTDASGAFRFDDVVLPAVVEVSASGYAVSSRLVRSSPADFRLGAASLAESVVVTGERAPTWRDGGTGSTIFDAGDLERLPSVTLDEAVRVVTGFSLFRRSSSRQSNPTTHGVTMRGLSASGASRGLVLMDGTVLNDGFGGWVTWTRVPALAIERVDVTRGAAGDAFGSDALGGVLQIVAPSGHVTSWTAVARAGSLGLGALDGSAGGRVENWAMFGAASWLTTDGSIPVEPDSRGAVDQKADAEWANGFGQATGTWGARRLSLSAWGGRDDRGNGTALQRNRMSGGTFAAAFDTTAGETTLAARVSASPNTFYQTFTAVNAARSSENLISTQTTDTQTTRAVVEAGRVLTGAHLLGRLEISRASADFRDVRSSGTTDESLDDRREALTLQASIAPAGAVTVSGGVRHEWRAAPLASSGRESATVGHARAAWNVTPEWSLRASAASSHRWPTLNELVRGFRVGNVVTNANPDLLPERAVSLDGAVAYDGGRWQVSAGGFWTAVDDAIANVTVSSGATIVRQRRNAGETRSKGLELDAEMRPGRGSRVRASLALTSAKFQTSAESALVGNDLPQVPGAAFSLWVDAPLPRGLTASAVVRAISTQFDDDRNTFELSSATQLDLGLSGRINRLLRWRVELENVFDADIEVGRTPLVTLAPPRSVRFGLTLGR